MSAAVRRTHASGVRRWRRWRRASKFTFLYVKLSWLAPTVGTVQTTSFTQSLYRMVDCPRVPRS